MATTERTIDSPAGDVFHVLAAPASYPHRVVGPTESRASDDDWRRVGSTFHRTQGKWPLTVKDTSPVIEAESHRRLVLEVRTRPFVAAKVELELTPHDGKTH